MDNDETVDNNRRLSITSIDFKNKNIDDYLQTIIKRCNRASKKQGRLFFINKIINSVLMIPAILLPIIVANLEGKVSTNVLTGLLITTSSLTAVMGFFKLDLKAANNSKFETKFMEIKNEIEQEIIKKQEDRLNVNVFSQKVLDSYNNTSSQAPNC